MSSVSVTPRFSNVIITVNATGSRFVSKFWRAKFQTVGEIGKESRIFCGRTKMPLEVGEWKQNLKHMDTAVVENRPVFINEGQIYVYENYFPGYTINYIHVDNVAIRSCGAGATIKKGGIGSSTVLIVLHAETNEEIRSVIDIWGTKNNEPEVKNVTAVEDLKSMKSLYLFKDLRAVNHNKAYYK